MIRKLNLGDLVKLEKYAKFPMPQILNPRYEIQWALLGERGELVGIVVGKKTCEVSMILDETLPWSTRIRAWTEAFDGLDAAGQLLGYDDVHAFVAGEDAEHHAKLMKRCGFVDATGIPLYYRLGESEWLRVRRNKQQECLRVSPQVPMLKRRKDSLEEEPLVVA